MTGALAERRIMQAIGTTYDGGFISNIPIGLTTAEMELSIAQYIDQQFGDYNLATGTVGDYISALYSSSYRSGTLRLIGFRGALFGSALPAVNAFASEIINDPSDAAGGTLDAIGNQLLNLADGGDIGTGYTGANYDFVFLQSLAYNWDFGIAFRKGVNAPAMMLYIAEQFHLAGSAD